VKVLFAMMHPGYMRYYHGALRALARRGHAIHLVFDIPHKQARDRLERRLVEEFPGQVTIGPAPQRTDEWEALARALTWGMDYLRYLQPGYRDRVRLRVRVEVVMHPTFRDVAQRLPTWGVRLLQSGIRIAYDAVPVSDAYLAAIREQGPDLVLVTPLVTQGAAFQSEYVRAGKALGLPVGYCVASWDNLTTKGLIRGEPDRVFLWNEIQRQEAVELHRTPRDRVVMTGAQLFDDWFAQRPRLDRAAFCRQVGLDPGRPFLLYMCSSNFMAPNEPPFTLRWIDALRRASDPRLRELGVLIRPYPEHTAPWRRVDLAALDNVAIWPREGAYPLTDDSRADFYDSVHHSEAVVGVNTSALIETAILGRPALTVLAEEFRNSQEGTVHFHYLRRDHGGFVEVASTLDAHLSQLSAALADRDVTARQVRGFVERFVRPHGLDRPATPIWVEAVERLAAERRRAAPAPSASRRVLRRVLAPLAQRVDRVRAGPAFRDHVEQWKWASRKAEEIGGDPLEVWQRLQAERRDTVPGGLTRYVVSRARRHIARRFQKLAGRVGKGATRLQRRVRRAIGGTGVES